MNHVSKNIKVEYCGTVYLVLFRKVNPEEALFGVAQEITLYDGRKILTPASVAILVRPNRDDYVVAVGEEIAPNQLWVSDPSDLLVRIDP